jgi:RNA polymerase sigma factor (sigma-70 family)
MRFASDALPIGVLGSRRVLALAGDDALVAQMRRGNEAAFEVAFERYGAQILGFCRHMLGSLEEAEDVVQHTFAAAFRDLALNAERSVALKPWLYTIARNRCLSLLRARREQAAVPHEASTIALAEEVERRAEVQELLEDILELPDDQRAALLLSQGGALSHAEVADVLGCDPAKVKGLVFRARSALIQRREARETPCAAIREQLANLRGGALRRSELRDHLRDCPGCRAYREHVRRQRRLLGAVLPVTPSLALKGSVLGGSAAGSLTAAGGGMLAKVAVTGVLVCGATAVVVDAQRPAVPPGGETTAAEASSRPATAAPATIAPAPLAAATRPVAGHGAGDRTAERRTAGRSRAAADRRAAAAERRAARDRRHAAGRGRAAERHAAARSRAADRRAARGRAQGPAGRGRARAQAAPGRAKAAPPAGTRAKPAPQGRGPIAAPPASTPVRRGPRVRTTPARVSAPPAPAPPGAAGPPKAKKP